MQAPSTFLAQLISGMPVSTPSPPTRPKLLCRHATPHVTSRAGGERPRLATRSIAVPVRPEIRILTVGGSRPRRNSCLQTVCSRRSGCPLPPRRHASRDDFGPCDLCSQEAARRSRLVEDSALPVRAHSHWGTSSTRPGRWSRCRSRRRRWRTRRSGNRCSDRSELSRTHRYGTDRIRQPQLPRPTRPGRTQ